MALVNHSVNNIINGVSQQSPAIRLDNQLEEQINCFSDVTKGLVIRNGIELTNVSATDLSDSDIIEFTLDGEKIILGLDPTAVTPLVHIPMTADVTALTSAITHLPYFANIQKGDIRVLEDKDKVYILNTKKQVGEQTTGTSFVDVIISNDSTSTVDTNWDSGEYELTITGEEDPTTVVVAVETLTITVNRSMTLADITALINADLGLIGETGECFITGTVSKYRIKFNEIPVNYIAPTISAVETVAITSPTSTITGDTGFVTTSDGLIREVQVQENAIAIWYFEAGPFAYTLPNVTTVNSGGFIYERGALERVFGTTNRYRIRRYSFTPASVPYSIEVQTPVPTASNNLENFPQEAMAWVTGVSSNQEYDLSIDWYDVNTLTVTTVTISATNVGTTPSQISLNWVAGQLVSKIIAAGGGNLTATQYDNAVHIVSIGDAIIGEVRVSNNFDNTSINSVIEAVAESTSGTLEISTLPSTFIEGFKLRVGVEDVSGANYYLKYSADFKGWKETGLDAGRTLDAFTMPQIIDKEKIRKTGIITIEPETWIAASAGDSESNKSPSFVSKNIKDIFFYSSRLGMATDDTLIMSSIDEKDTFYRTTASKTVVSDRVDIKLDSSKVGFNTIKHVTTFNQSIFINTGTTQSKLLVNTSFDLTSARLTEVSSYSLGEERPLPVENGLYFATTDGDFTNVTNYKSVGNDNFDIEVLTKHCPTYIEGTVDRMIYSKNLTVVSVNEDKKVLYTQNRFSRGGEMLQNAWHKWELPYDLDHMHFFNDKLHLIMSSEILGVPQLLIGKYNLKPIDVVALEDGSANINWTPYLDLYTLDKTLIEDFPEFIGINTKNGVKYDTVTEAFDSTLVNQIELTGETADTYSISGPDFYWRVDGNTNTIVFDDGTPIIFGNNTLTFFDDGGFRYFKGTDQTSGDFGVYRAAITTSSFNTTDIIYGIKYRAKIVLSQIISRQETPNGPIVMNYSTLMLRRMRVFLAKSGAFRVTVKFKNRQNYEIVYNGSVLGSLLLGSGVAEDFTFNFPINGKSNLVEITLETDSSTPFNLLSTEWQGQLITKGRNI